MVARLKGHNTVEEEMEILDGPAGGLWFSAMLSAARGSSSGSAFVGIPDPLVPNQLREAIEDVYDDEDVFGFGHSFD